MLLQPGFPLPHLNIGKIPFLHEKKPFFSVLLKSFFHFLLCAFSKETELLFVIGDYRLRHQNLYISLHLWLRENIFIPPKHFYFQLTMLMPLQCLLLLLSGEVSAVESVVQESHTNNIYYCSPWVSWKHKSYRTALKWAICAQSHQQKHLIYYLLR